MIEGASELDRIEGFLTQMNARVSERVIGWEGGVAYVTAALSQIWDVNFLDLRDASLTAAQIAAHAEDLMGAAGCEHRRVLVRDQDVGAALEPAFAELGWETDVHVIMAHHREPNRIVHTSAVEELGDATLPSRDEQIRAYAELKDDETVRQMRAYYYAAVEAGSGRDFGIVEDGKVVSFALLYSDGHIGQIEDVATLEAHRNRGYSWQVVTRVLEESRSRHDITFLIADDHDWPKSFYWKMGFDVLTRHYYFLRRPHGRSFSV